MRKKIIDAIIELSGDEFENSEDLILLASEELEQLIDRLISIATYYSENN